MLFTTNKIENEELNSINNFFESFENEVATVSPEEANKETSVSRYITSLVSGLYTKSVEDIANTNVGNKIVRKRNLQQVMKESFFYGANRFGNNFIA
jgi:archaellum component FlaC